MSKVEGARARGPEPDPARLNYFNYFTEIEETFVRRRGKHLLLSPLDWDLMQTWKALNIPLHVVLRGVEKAFDSYESRPRNRSVKSLYYCQEEVEAQFAEWLASQLGASAGGTAEAEEKENAADAETESRGLPFPRPVISAHLAESRAALEESFERQRAKGGGGGELCEALARAAARLAELEKDFAASARPNAEQLENSLSDLESLLDRALRASLPSEVLEGKRAQAEEQLSAYRKRMERAAYEQTLDNLLARLLREECRVPRLSLFYL
jgi:hypothetical protein